jgi:hypothetical protein
LYGDSAAVDYLNIDAYIDTEAAVVEVDWFIVGNQPVRTRKTRK